mmetsp:Transcript_12468/g.28312  ORF Transcript_12468/g.28312 Transcript_12468/m.28312 type:complete len:212 (-) Transcript_12468:380-1015(-)
MHPRWTVADPFTFHTCISSTWALRSSFGWDAIDFHLRRWQRRHVADLSSHPIRLRSARQVSKTQSRTSSRDVWVACMRHARILVIFKRFPSSVWLQENVVSREGNARTRRRRRRKKKKNWRRRRKKSSMTTTSTSAAANQKIFLQVSTNAAACCLRHRQRHHHHHRRRRHRRRRWVLALHLEERFYRRHQGQCNSTKAANLHLHLHRTECT